VIIILSLDILVQIQNVLDIMTVRLMGLDLVGRPRWMQPSGLLNFRSTRCINAYIVSTVHDIVVHAAMYIYIEVLMH